MAQVTFDVNAVMNRLNNATEKAIHITSQQALKDCNYYCKQDQSGLIDSSITHSDLESGKLIWKTPYARKQYYLKATSKDVNSNAEWMWAHKAAAEHKKEWFTVFKNACKQFAKE